MNTPQSRKPGQFESFLMIKQTNPNANPHSLPSVRNGKAPTKGGPGILERERAPSVPRGRDPYGDNNFDIPSSSLPMFRGDKYHP
mmetsp:Transcript_175/g.145  ORF Transcript_175/g.145 Transcript_175/m.145 type:complete len:85 (+) Transcript_175:1973-2227(+)